MNTPQQIAASMVADVADDIYNQTEFAHLGEMDKATVTDCIAELPLTELIAVASAANGFMTATEAVKSFDFEVQLEAALAAIRATGKIKL